MVLGAQSRVKAAASLRQKILRKSMYKRYHSAQEVLDNLSDLVGLRVECRFLDDEGVLFDVLRKMCIRDRFYVRCGFERLGAFEREIGHGDMAKFLLLSRGL